METLLFAVGIAIFMITVYGTVMAGGEMLKKKQIEGLADDVDIITDEHGTEYLVGSSSPDAPRED